jgi:hypothetical protein
MAITVIIQNQFHYMLSNITYGKQNNDYAAVSGMLIISIKITLNAGMNSESSKLSFVKRT